MYEFIDDMPENIVGLRLSGKITEDELEGFLGTLHNSSHKLDHLRLLIVFDNFEEWPNGTYFRLAQFLVSHRAALDHIALAGDDKSARSGIPNFVPGIEMKSFEDEAAALDWLRDETDFWRVDPLRYSAEVRDPKDLRILIVGAGVAGLTLASMLQQRDMHPTVIEDAEDFGKIGYVIILMSAGGRILKGLGVHDQLHQHGVWVRRYDIANTDGEILRQHKVAEEFAGLFGDSFSIYRPALVDVIKQSMKDQSVIRMGTTVDAIEQNNDEVHVTFSDGSTGTFDLVVGTDGLHSKVRQLVWGEVPMTYSGLHGWAWWGEKKPEFENRALEYWGTGGAFGLYPTEDRLCVVGVVETEPGEADDPANRKERIREIFGDWGGWVPYGLEQLDTMDTDKIFHDDFWYGNQENWYKGRVVLAGDSVHSFSPISGMGASMAMESASVLAEELCYVDSRFIDQALSKYQERRKLRVVTLQQQAQSFGDLVTSGNPLVSNLRNLAVEHVDSGPIHHFLARIPYQPV
jgi:2-polyprenyl-6-methoxyphenol hydroxylase-like FAD-dependent oxidoreductase